MYDQNTYGGSVYFGDDEHQSLSRPIILQKSSPKRFRKVLLVISLIILVLIVGGVVVGVVISRGSANKEDMAQKVEGLYSLIIGASYTGQCSAVVKNINDMTVSISEYESYISVCLEDAKKIQDYIDSVAFLFDSDEYKRLYAELKIAISDGMILGDELDKALEICAVWHEWRLKLGGLSIYQTPEDITKFASKLIDLGDESLANYATGWAVARTNLVDAYIMDGLDTISYNEAKLSYDTAVNDVPDVLLIAGFDKKDEKKMIEVVIKYKQYVEKIL